LEAGATVGVGAGVYTGTGTGTGVGTTSVAVAVVSVDVTVDLSWVHEAANNITADAKTSVFVIITQSFCY
jgi:uncharacterized membrane protein